MDYPELIFITYIVGMVGWGMAIHHDRKPIGIAGWTLYVVALLLWPVWIWVWLALQAQARISQRK